MKLALASKHCINDIKHNFKCIIDSINLLKDQVDVVCFGEAYLHGFDALSWDYEIDKNITICLDSIYIKDIQNAAKINNIAVSFGFFEHFNDEIYCSYIFIDKYGSILNVYRRVSVGWKEVNKCDFHYKEGNKFNAFKFMGKEIVIALCGDLWYDENISEIRKLNKDFIIWPLHIDYPLGQWEKEIDDYINQTKMLEVPVLMINNISDTSLGGCYLFNDGKIDDELKMGEEGYLIINI